MWHVAARDRLCRVRASESRHVRCGSGLASKRTAAEAGFHAESHVEVLVPDDRCTPWQPLRVYPTLSTTSEKRCNSNQEPEEPTKPMTGVALHPDTDTVKRLTDKVYHLMEIPGHSQASRFCAGIVEFQQIPNHKTMFT